MLKEELLRKKAALANGIDTLEQKIKPLEWELNKKREMLQHIVRLVELDDGDITSHDENGQPSSVSPLIPIFADYKGQRYDAQLDVSRISGSGGQCVLFHSRWMTTSNAANSIPTANNTNGWRFWRYRRDDGAIAIIDELRP